MARLGLKELANVAEVIAALAVVVSLVYVGGEVQSNTAAVRGAAMQAIATTDAEVLMAIASDSALSEIVRVGYEDPSRLSQGDAFRFSLFMRQFWLTFQNVYKQAELELVDPSVWESYVSVICGMWTRPGVREVWPDHRPILDPGFAAIAEGCSEG